MPELHARRGRDFSPGPAVQYDPTAQHETGYQRDRRRAALATGQRRRGTRDGYAVEIRNGIPFRPYPICNSCGRRGHLEMDHADA